MLIRWTAEQPSGTIFWTTFWNDQWAGVDAEGPRGSQGCEVRLLHDFRASSL